ncbi:ribosomal protein L3 N(5)-glutamine methyltransferase [Chromatiales bacterium (ex Bugula neritina AB1)]|nr:ribosomal protein L3 N(5)-glutamine methyltransferase [Chromatiales bacterium (ex Bugula neritina AB1)]
MNENSLRLFQLQITTVAELIDMGCEYLTASELVYGHGTDNALDESAWLALEACDISPAEPLDDYNIPVTSEQLQRAREWFRARAERHVPVAYLTGRSWFAGLEFITDSRALIPRSPIAELIAARFAPWLAAPPAAALDLCCGGGCIAIAMATVFPDSVVHASDLSEDALQLAALNRQKYALQGRLQLFHGDLFAPLPEGQCYDLIVSNPPYVDEQDMRSLADEFHHEPAMGLAAGYDGLDIVARMLWTARQYLSPDGIMVVEVGNSQQAVEQRFAGLDLLWLDFEFGGAGVFLVSAQALHDLKPD